MLPPEKVEVLRNLRDGDVIWITVAPGVSDEAVEQLHEAATEGIAAEVTVFVTASDFVEGIKVLDLGSLLMVREVIDAAILRLAAESGVGEES